MKKTLLIILSFVALNSYAQKNNKGTWFGTFAKKKITQKDFLWLENQLRYSFDNGGMQQFLYRTGWLRELNKTQGMGLLYGFIQSNSSKEHRLTLQFTQIYNPLMNLKFSSRSRLEYRALEDNDDKAIRLRHLLRLESTINEREKAVLWNEIFLNLNETQWTAPQTFDRNRLFIGLNNKTQAGVKIEYGYLNQYIPRSAKNTMEHLAVLYIFF